MSTNKSIFSHFFSGTLFIGGARVTSIILGIVSVILATRFLTTDAYGTYVLVMLLSSTTAEVISFGLGMVIQKYLAGNKDENYQTILINTVLNSRIITVVAIGLLIFAIRPFVAGYFNNKSVIDIFTATPIVFFLVSLAQLFEAVLRGQFKFRAIGVIEFFTEVIELIILIVFVVVYRFGFWGLILAKIVSRVIWIILAYRTVKFKHSWELNVSLLKELLKFGFPLQMQYIFSFAFSKLDTLIVGSLLGTRGVAFYDIAKKIPDSLGQLYSVFITVYFPLSANIYATEKREKTDYILNNSIRLITFMGVLAALVIVFFGKSIIVLLFSKEYLGIYWVLVLLMIGLVIEMVEGLLGYSLVAVGEPDKPLYISVIRSVVSVLGNLIVLPIMGYVGAAVIYILGNIIALPANAFFIRKKGISPNIIPFLKLFFIFALLLISSLLWGNNNFLVSLFFVLLYFPLSFFLSIITVRDGTILVGELSALWGKLRAKLSSESKVQ